MATNEQSSDKSKSTPKSEAKMPASSRHSPTDPQYNPDPDRIAARLGLIDPNMVKSNS